MNKILPIKQIRAACSITFEDTRGPACLHLRQDIDGSKPMDETHDSQSGMLYVGRKNMLVQTNAVSRLVCSIARQIRKTIVVTCGEHNCIHL